MTRNSKTLTVVAVITLVAAAFGAGTYFYSQRTDASQAQVLSQENTRLVRPHSPVMGPTQAPVTLVEFFDPACESCRAFYPHVKALLKQYPQDLRVVLRYAPFHEGSDQVVRLLEAARRQDKFLAVLEKVLEDQPLWADHGQPRLARVYESAAKAGLDMKRAEEDALRPEVSEILKQDVEDLNQLGIQRTPTFVVNGRGLTRFGPEPLAALVAEEVARSRARNQD